MLDILKFLTTYESYVPRKNQAVILLTKRVLKGQVVYILIRTGVKRVKKYYDTRSVWLVSKIHDCLFSECETVVHQGCRRASTEVRCTEMRGHYAEQSSTNPNIKEKTTAFRNTSENDCSAFLHSEQK